jgi:DNA-binding FrmR family transcriptional regulator
MPLGSWKVDRLAAGALAVAAGLLLANAYLVKRIALQAAEVEQSLERSRDATHVLFDISRVNGAMEKMTKRLAQQRTGEQA